VLLGLARFEEAIHTLRLTGLDVLVTNRRNNAAGIEQIARPETANIIKEISRNYDNVIIDTSPVLATPDALLWAKMADAVVLSSLAGQSIGYDLKETLERMAQVNVKILGNVLSNVSAKYSYHRYGYGYGCYGGNGSDTKGKSNSASSKPLLLSIQSQSNKTDEAGS
jgi:tyrosine-protein kinase Etk/Wzc